MGGGLSPVEDFVDFLYLTQSGPTSGPYEWQVEGHNAAVNVHYPIRAYVLCSATSGFDPGGPRRPLPAVVRALFGTRAAAGGGVRRVDDRVYLLRIPRPPPVSGSTMPGGGDSDVLEPELAV